MNCKPGDVAIIVKGRWPNVGRIVQVVRDFGLVDYSDIGYGVLPCWRVESLGGDLDTLAGPSKWGYTPDLSLRPIPGISPEQSEAIRQRRIQAKWDEAIEELRVIARQMEEQEALIEE